MTEEELGTKVGELVHARYQEVQNLGEDELKRWFAEWSKAHEARRWSARFSGASEAQIKEALSDDLVVVAAAVALRNVALRVLSRESKQEIQ